ncbi:MAG: hypothetical protein K2I93_02895 [Oscillospiraceae bacterium]|nr:hypothetical protein [Oscillospiraceae bacterium]
MRGRIVASTGALLLIILLGGCAGQQDIWRQIDAFMDTALSDKTTEQPSETTAVPQETVHTALLETLPSASSSSTAPTAAQTVQPTTSVQDLTADEVYVIFCQELREFHTEFTISGKITGDMLDEAYYRVYRENPELFWVSGYSAEYNSVRADVKVTTLNDADVSTLRQMSQAVESVADSVAAAAMAYPDDYSRLLYVHDYIVEHTVYDEDGAAANQSDIGLCSWSTAYGCLVEGKAVCIGYAEAFQLIAQKLGIPCGICTGEAKGVSHAWNYVYTDGAYYWVDVTWDDPTPENTVPENIKPEDTTQSYLHHAYFMINDEQLYRTRTVDQDNGMVPVCDRLDNNYYVRNRNYLTSYSFSEINSRMSAVSDSIEVMFSDYGSYEQAKWDLFTNNMIWYADVFNKKGGSYWYYHDDDMYILRLEFETN